MNEKKCPFEFDPTAKNSISDYMDRRIKEISLYDLEQDRLEKRVQRLEERLSRAEKEIIFLCILILSEYIGLLIGLWM